jgi:hypothetical protein
VTHVIIRGSNGRRHEVDFQDAEITVEFFANETAVELVIEAQDDDRPWEKKRFALVSLPRAAFDKAMAEQARSKSASPKAVD